MRIKDIREPDPQTASSRYDSVAAHIMNTSHSRRSGGLTNRPDYMVSLSDQLWTDQTGMKLE